MPLYEYECDACGRRFELIQKFSDSPVKKCTVCSGAVRKLLSSPAIHFKGTGWYVTDYAAKDKKSSEQSTDGATATAADGDKKPTEGTKSKDSGAKSETASESSSSPSTKQTAEPASSSSSSKPS